MAATNLVGLGDRVSRAFKLQENQSTLRGEVVGGLTTFVTMAYVVIVNPRILADAGMPVDGVLFATCISAAVATLIMGLYANYPIVLAPGMALNAYFTYSIVLGMGIPWRAALGVVFISGVLFLFLTVTGIRGRIINSIPPCIRQSVPAGIGMFIAFIGLRNANLVVADENTLVSLGDFSEASVQVACLGVLLTGVLVGRRVRGAILLGILGTTGLAAFMGLTELPSQVVSTPDASSTFLQLDLAAGFRLGLLEIVFVFLFVDLFDSIGTILGVCEQAGLTQNGRLPRANRALVADGVGTVVGSLTGTSTVTSYIESAAGVSAGARTGLSSILVAALFLGAMFFSPLVAAIPSIAVAPALLIVGALMVQSIRDVNWKDFTESLPAFVILLVTPLTFSVATGLSLGLIVFSVVKVAAGKGREVSWLLWILTLVFVLRYAYLSVR